MTNRAKRPWHVRLLRRVRLDYLKILRTEGAPTQVARGVGYGIFVELLFFPSLGLAFILMSVSYTHLTLPPTPYV